MTSNVQTVSKHLDRCVNKLITIHTAHTGFINCTVVTVNYFTRRPY